MHVHVPRRRTVRAGVALGLAVAALHWATPSQATGRRAPQPVVLTGDPVTQTVPMEAMLRAGLSPQQAMRWVVERQLVSLGLPRQSFVQSTEPTRSPTAACGLLTPNTSQAFQHSFTADVGDLDGNRQRDVVETHTYYDGKRSTGYLSAREARTGRLLWSSSTDLTPVDPLHEFAGVGAFAAHVGARHAPGVIFLRVKVRSISVGTTSTITISYDFTGLDGHGRQVWHRAFSGMVTIIETPETVTIIWKNFAWAFVLGHFRPGAEDLVVHRVNTTASGQRSDLDRYALDTGTLTNPYGGSPPSLLSPVTDLLLPSTQVDNVGVVSDQNGDGREDLYVVTVLSPGGGLVTSSLGVDKVEIHRGDTGAPLWEGPPFPRGGQVVVVDAGVITQESRIHDLAVVASQPGGLSVGGTDQSTDRADGTVMLLKGGTGALAWALPGASVFPMWRYQGRRAIGIVSTSTTTPSASGKVSLSLDVDVRDGQGLAVATVSHLIRVPSSCNWFVYTVNPGVDLTHDASPDLQVSTITFPGGGAPFVEGALTLDGATGKELDHTPTAYLPASVNGAGLSRSTWARHAHDVTYSVRRGDKVTSVLATVIVPRAASDWTALTSVLGTDARCADLMTDSFTPTPASSTKPSYRDVERLLGANGKPWWTLVVDPRHPLGVLTTGKGAKDLC